MTLDIARIRDGYKQRYPAYCQLVALATPKLHTAVRACIQEAVIDGRPKEPYSFVQKAIRKYLERPEEYADPLERIGDGAGLRVIVAHLSEATVASRVATEIFDALDVEDVGERYEPNELGYLGIHIQARLKSTDVDPKDTYLLDYTFEVQIHTKAQDAWSTVSHPLLYKPPGGQPSKAVSAKVYRAVALVSLFDEQVAEARAAILTDRRYRPAAMLDILHRQFLDWLQHPGDDTLSLHILEVLQAAYDEIELSKFEEIIDLYVRENRDRLTAILTLYTDAADSYPVLFQPEMIAIAERLDRAPQKLAGVWQLSGLPSALLSETATALGRPIT
jgi:ppGpp synthetase/RelA/SpoT-type nucleotidyltranferase